MKSFLVDDTLKGGGLDFVLPKDNLYAFAKIWGALDQPVIGAFHGLMYGRVGTSRMVPLFGYAGTGVIECRFDEAGDLWLRGKETGFFTDLVSGDILQEWDNPWTGERVPVFDFFNDRMGGKITAEMPRFDMGSEADEATLMNEGTAKTQAGTVPFLLPFERYGDDVMLGWDYCHEYDNPVDPAHWPKASTGPRINPSEHFTFSVNANELADKDLPTVRSVAGFTRLAPWWPWMQMGGSVVQNGLVFGRMHSHKGLAGLDDVPPKLRAHVERNHPEYLEVPDSWFIEKPKSTWEAYAEQIPAER